MTAEVATWGAAVVSLRIPDRRGRLDDVVLGHADLDGYVRRNAACLGVTVGRHAGRIAGGDLPIDGVCHALTRNDGPDHLHGGARGFGAAVWAAEPLADEAGLVLRHVSPAGEEGYPGTLAVDLSIRLGDDALSFAATATCDAPTIVNLVHHGYWNLELPGRRDVLGHRLWIPAERFAALGPGMIPTGELLPVGGTPLDLRAPAVLGERLSAGHPLLRAAGGFDHDWLLDRPAGGLAFAGRLTAPGSGRAVEVLTTEPALHVYTGNQLDGTLAGKDGLPYGPHAGLCLEAQHLPDAPHHPHFPSVVLRPGETYRTETIYRFGVEG
jgi:aldose 1-epimerase